MRGEGFDASIESRNYRGRNVSFPGFEPRSPAKEGEAGALACPVFLSNVTTCRV